MAADESSVQKDVNLLDSQQLYKPPQLHEELIDTTTGEVVDQKTLSPLQRLQIVADKMGMKIKPPNPNCTKAGCYGRGYVGFDSKTGAPIPCRCIFEKADLDATKDKTSPAFWNRSQRRRFEKMANKYRNKKPAKTEEVTDGKAA